MTEMGPCVGRCRVRCKCFFVKQYFLCPHMQCYNLTVKLRCCVRCGNAQLRHPMHNDNDEEVEMSSNILGTQLCCVRR